jgi:hypothetical protein
MVDGAKAVSSSVKRESSKLQVRVQPYRSFADRPLDIFVDQVIQELKDHAQPEKIEALYRSAIPKDVEFFIIRPITLDGKKRPEGDNAPCPMCTPNRFLSGALIYIPSMQCCAIIGHCCADKDAQAKADREYKIRHQRDHEENYLLRCLPLVAARMDVLENLKGSATEAQRIFRRFRKGVPRIHEQLRRTKHQFHGHLRLSEIIRGGEDDERTDYVGPAGFRGRGSTDIETREIDFGLLSGTIAVNADYNPVKELETITRQLASIDPLPTEEAALNFICEITIEQRRAAVAILEGVDWGVERFVDRLRGFEQFFTADNASILKTFGDSPHNAQGFGVVFEWRNGQSLLTFWQAGTKCALQYGNSAALANFKWPGPEC